MDAPPPTTPSRRSSRVDFLLYLGAAVSYIVLATQHLWLLNWVVGPLWCVAWVWGLPALARLVRGEPVRPRRGT
jgi:hypothetical protein